MDKINKKVVLISLGCAKNLVDSEYTIGMIKESGYVVVPYVDEADIAIINTCGFIQSAVEESIETILRIAEKKLNGKLIKLFVMGCLVQRYGYKLEQEIPEVDAWFGVGRVKDILFYLKDDFNAPSRVVIKEPCDSFRDLGYSRRIQSTPPWSAYLKIADGCSNRCSFCTIPSIKGPYRSRPFDLIISDAKGMAQNGVKEINIIAQDTTMYGVDTEGDYSIERLIEALAGIGGIRWIRLLYCHPWKIKDSLLNIINDYEIVCPYIDIPLQHVNTDILKRMGRYSEKINPYDLIEKIRSKSDDICIRTTMMVGFPGEGKKEFRELLDFIRWAEFDNLGAFIYSPEHGTRAYRFKDRVDERIARERLEELMTIQQEISLRKNRGKIGTVQEVLIEGESYDKDFPLQGRTVFMAPEVDGRVFIKADKKIEAGMMIPVMIKDATEYDLKGVIKVAK